MNEYPMCHTPDEDGYCTEPGCRNEGKLARYYPVSSAARQAWIDGEDDPNVLRGIDAENWHRLS